MTCCHGLELGRRIDGIAVAIGRNRRANSMKASPQLIRMTVKSGTSLKRRCQYQGVVMNTLEPSSSKMGSRYGTEMVLALNAPRCRGGWRIGCCDDAGQANWDSSKIKIRTKGWEL